jgi:hypothetical protein
LLNVCSSISWGRRIKLQCRLVLFGAMWFSLLLVGVGVRRLTSHTRSSHPRTFSELGSLEASVKGQKTGLGRD